MLTRRTPDTDAATAPIRSTLAAGAAAVLALAAALAVTGGPAAAAPGAECPPGQGDCNVWEHDPGDPDGDGGSTNPGGGDGGSGDGDRVCEKDDGTVVPCYDELRGWFNSADDCYYKRAEPQPPDVEEGLTAYLRTCGPSSQLVFLADPPAGFDPPDPREVALDLLAGLNLDPPDLHTAPSGVPGLVGVPVWLYDASNWDTVRDDDSQGEVTVEIEAIPTKIVWNLGNGESVTCTSAGIPFRAGVHDPRQPPAGACAYDGYPRSSHGRDGEKYPITATKYWTVPWSSSTGGDEEPLSAELTGETSIQVDELQVVTR